VGEVSDIAEKTVRVQVTIDGIYNTLSVVVPRELDEKAASILSAYIMAQAANEIATTLRKIQSSGHRKAGEVPYTIYAMDPSDA
jgi:hypothetical protein